MTAVTKAQLGVLRNAAERPGGHICPTHGLRAAAQQSVIDALRRKGLATDEIAPRITDAGRVLVTVSGRDDGGSGGD